jgi:hypothetical protein
MHHKRCSASPSCSAKSSNSRDAVTLTASGPVSRSPVLNQVCSLAVVSHEVVIAAAQVAGHLHVELAHGASIGAQRESVS